MKTLKQPPIHGTIDVQSRPINYRAVQLTWDNWGSVCTLVPFNRFVAGVWVHPENRAHYSHNPFPDIPATDQHIGLLIRNPKDESIENHIELINQGTWILYDKESDTIAHCTPDKFGDLFRIIPTTINQ
jgi:hypothetical protein